MIKLIGWTINMVTSGTAMPGLSTEMMAPLLAAVALLSLSTLGTGSLINWKTSWFLKGWRSYGSKLLLKLSVI